MDALLSLSNIRDISTNIDTELWLDDNALLVKIGGQAICEDMAPTESRLGQVDVDSEIARMIASEEQTNLEKSETQPCSTPLIGVPEKEASEQLTAISKTKQGTSKQGDDKAQDETSSLLGIPTNDQPTTDSTPKQSNLNTGTRPKTVDITAKKGSKGAFKSQLYRVEEKRS